MDPREGAEPPPQNKNPEVIVSAVSSGIEFLQAYGWFLVLGIAVLFYLKQKFSPTLQEWQRKKEEQSAFAFDASVSARRAEAMEASRQRLQQQLDSQAEKYKEKQREKEEEKRQAKIQDWDNHQKGKGYRSKVKSQESDPSESSGPKPRKTNTYRPNDYNPLMGGGGGGSYAPPRRGGRGGG